MHHKTYLPAQDFVARVKRVRSTVATEIDPRYTLRKRNFKDNIVHLRRAKQKIKKRESLKQLKKLNKKIKKEILFQISTLRGGPDKF